MKWCNLEGGTEGHLKKLLHLSPTAIQSDALLFGCNANVGNPNMRVGQDTGLGLFLFMFFFFFFLNT